MDDQNSFFNNKAGYTGGAIQWLTTEPILQSQYSLSSSSPSMFSGNYAGVYGSDIAGEATQLTQITDIES